MMDEGSLRPGCSTAAVGRPLAGGPVTATLRTQARAGGLALCKTRDVAHVVPLPASLRNKPGPACAVLHCARPVTWHTLFHSRRRYETNPGPCGLALCKTRDVAHVVPLPASLRNKPRPARGLVLCKTPGWNMVCHPAWRRYETKPPRRADLGDFARCATCWGACDRKPDRMKISGIRFCTGPQHVGRNTVCHGPPESCTVQDRPTDRPARRRGDVARNMARTGAPTGREE